MKQMTDPAKGMLGLRAIRIEHHWNQQKVAMALNLSREAYSHYETGRREPSFATLVMMSEYFNVSIDYLITGKEFEANKSRQV